ncbi:MAG: HAD family hydrolase [Chloroflexi bacterium]|nr:HAD family hydrolase [Chloroflexota bacterium]
MIKAIFFDLYDTLIHYYPQKDDMQLSVCNLFNIKNVDIDSIRRGNYAADKFFYRENDKYPLYKRSEKEKTIFYIAYEKILLQAAGIDIPDNLIILMFQELQKIEKKMVLFDDVIPTFQMLKKRKITLGLISNAQLDSVPLQGLGLTYYIDILATSDTNEKGKPHPEIFLNALNLASVKPEEALHVGDQYEVDIIGAKGVGIKPLLLDRYDILKDLIDCTKIQSLTQIQDYL